MEIIVIIVFAILAIIEGRKEKRDPTYRSWMSDGSHSWDQRRHNKDS